MPSWTGSRIQSFFRLNRNETAITMDWDNLLITNHFPFFGLLLAVVLAGAQGVVAQTVPIYALSSAPTVDGDAADWGDLPATIVPLRKTKPDSVVRAESVAIRGGTYDDRVYLFVEWRDDSEDVVHKPWVWNSESNKYVKGPQREDRLAVQFSSDDN